MKKNLIPLYREKEIYTLFYDPKQNKLYRFPHRKSSSGLYIGLFLLVLYGSSVLNTVYQPYRSFLLNVVLLLVMLIACYFLSIFFGNRYYIQKMDQDVFYGPESMERIAEEGMKQLRRETTYGIPLAIVMTLFGFVPFFLSSQIELLIIGGLGLMPLYVILISRPIKRKTVLKKFQEKELKL